MRGIEPKTLMQLVLALVFGVALGSLSQLDRFTGGLWYDPSESSEVEGRGNHAIRSGEMVNAKMKGGRSLQSPEEEKELSEHMSGSGEPQMIRVDENTVLVPARKDGVFVGFEIVASELDERLPVGSIIVAVNGMPVDDSPAGSELLIAALADGLSDVEVLGADDGEE